MPISVTNFPFRVASRRYSYGGTADERPVICNTDNEVPEEQEWAISEANTAARAVRKKKDNPYTPKPEPRSRAEPQDRIVDSTGGGAGTIQGALADDSERSPPAPVTIPMAVTAAEAAMGSPHPLRGTRFWQRMRTRTLSSLLTQQPDGKTDLGEASLPLRWPLSPCMWMFSPYTRQIQPVGRLPKDRAS